MYLRNIQLTSARIWSSEGFTRPGTSASYASYRLRESLNSTGSEDLDLSDAHDVEKLRTGVEADLEGFYKDQSDESDYCSDAELAYDSGEDEMHREFFGRQFVQAYKPAPPAAASKEPEESIPPNVRAHMKGVINKQPQILGRKIILLIYF